MEMKRSLSFTNLFSFELPQKSVKGAESLFQEWPRIETQYIIPAPVTQ